MKDAPLEENSNLLWTGGWDSTFQLLQLLLIHRRRVTPFYLIDAERPSTGVEIRTMQRIKNHLAKEYPHTKELLQPTRYFAVADISPDCKITEAYLSCFNGKHLGTQYEWLARFCKENGITDMQLCVQADRRPDKADCFDNDLDRILSEGTDGVQMVLRIDPKFKETSEYLVFRYFSFPVFRLTKIQMFSIGKKEGWEATMNMTWFCHSPTKNTKPCGKCTPCFQTIKEGLGWRIPVKSRLIHFFHRFLIRPLKSRVKLIHGKLDLPKYPRTGA